MTIPAPPTVGPLGQDAQRIEYTRMCRRILYGEHLADVQARIQARVPTQRKEAWGTPDMGSNPYKAVWTSLATLYDAAPSVTVDGAEAEVTARVVGVGLWPLMARVCRDTLGLREMWLRVDAVPRAGVEGAADLTYEPLYPDMVCAAGTAERPDVPVIVWHARLRHRSGQDHPEWVWDALDVSDPDAPRYQLLLPTRDGLELVDEYPWPDRWRDAMGRPILPYVLYHAARTPYIYDPYQSRELVEGTLDVAVLRTFVAHVARNAAWRQRWAIDCEPAGAGTVSDDGTPRTSVVTDPATVSIWRRHDVDGANPQLGTFEVPVIPAELWSYIDGYTRQMLTEAGITPPDAQALGGDPRSGYALAISRDTQREAQRRFSPMFARSDSETLRLSAIMLNRMEGSNLPEFGYRVSYHGVPQSSAERDAVRRHVLDLRDAGLISRLDAYIALNPGLTRDQAKKALAEIDTNEVSNG